MAGRAQSVIVCRRSIRDAIARADHLEADLSIWDSGSLAFLAGCDELVTELEQLHADARDLAALAHAEAGIGKHGETQRPYLRGALERWPA